jgi:hypothetical protein
MAYTLLTGYTTESLRHASSRTTNETSFTSRLLDELLPGYPEPGPLDSTPSPSAWNYPEIGEPVNSNVEKEVTQPAPLEEGVSHLGLQSADDVQHSFHRLVNTPSQSPEAYSLPYGNTPCIAPLQLHLTEPSLLNSPLVHLLDRSNLLRDVFSHPGDWKVGPVHIRERPSTKTSDTASR